MSNSPLVSYTQLSPNNSGTRTHAIDRITPHCVVGQCTVESLGALFAQTSRKASSNYGIGKDGKVGMYVPESCRAWTSSSQANDQRAVTIECASDTTYPYAFNSTVYARLIDLCVDICHRNGKKKLLWFDSRVKALEYEPAADEMVLTVHRWLASTQCPGDWLMQRMNDLATQVTKQLGGTGKPESENVRLTCNVALPMLKVGDRNGYVRSLQALLISQKYSCGGWGADGDFGSATLTAVKNFQRNHSLTADGVCGSQTWAALISCG